MNNKKYCPSKPPHVWKTDEGRSKKNTLFIHTSKPCTLWLSVIEIGFIWCLSQCFFGGRSCKHTETRWEELSQANSDDSWRRAGRLCVLYLTYCNLQYYWKKKKIKQRKCWGPISPYPHTDRNTHCVTLCASRLRSASLLTIARSPPRSEHCCRASVQLNSPGTIWKQREDSASYTPSFGQWGEAGRGQKHSHDFPDCHSCNIVERYDHYFNPKKDDLQKTWLIVEQNCLSRLVLHVYRHTLERQ